MEIKDIYNDILLQLKKQLEDYAERKGSVLESVVENLEEHHVEAAIWINQKYKMTLNARNFNDLIFNWDALHMLVTEMPDKEISFDGVDKLPPTDFNPTHLIEFLKSKH